MFKYIKVFDNHTDYMADKDNFDLPNTSYCIQENEVHYNPYVHDYSQDYLTFEALEDGTFQFTKAINYSTDGGATWAELAANTTTPTVTVGSKIMWRAEITPGSSYPSFGIGTFSSTGNFNAEGNVMSLLYGDNFKDQTGLTEKNHAFYQLFNNCSNLINAKNLSLPVTTLANSCYEFMFNGCTNLVTAPALPATTLANSCYSSMFQGCTSLTAAPALPATTLANYCYGSMFYDCTSLTTAPELPAITLAENCYDSMFQGCTSLTTAPVLPATTLANYCYNYMFYDCTSLTTAPVLPATTLISDCYRYMFYGCRSLNYIKAMFTTTPSTAYTQNWVNSVASMGTFVKNTAATWNVTGVDGIPTGWTVQTASA